MSSKRGSPPERFILSILLFCFCTNICVFASATTDKLVTIGIIAQPASDMMKMQYYHPSENWSYVAGSYVDWLGTTGAMPVLIPFDLPRQEMDHILENIDGVLFPGGGAPLMELQDSSKPTFYQESINYITEWAIERNKAGNYFPLFGTCLGFENMIITFSNATKALDCTLDDEVVAHSIKPTPAFDESRLWGEIGIEQAKKIFRQDSMYYTHGCGIKKTEFDKNEKFKAAFNLLGTSYSKKGVEFAAIIEHKTWPIWASQWHAEKNLFERGELYSFLDRSSEVTALMRKIAAKFVGSVRQHGKPKKMSEISPQVKEFFVNRRTSELLPLKSFERAYTFQRYSTRK